LTNAFAALIKLTLFPIKLGLFAAKILYACVPCLYVFEPFLNAYSTTICFPDIYWPFIALIALSEA